ncbi:hypothetical protein AB0H76_27945 [Nocardia sp. NPDC050712]|uniref:hypothetical protein n=1 Tax=Nocardia sp. NPDC050712 TaxID=3155518 RepID=UPI0033E25385
MKRFVTTGLIAVAAGALVTVPAQAEGPDSIGSPETGSAEVVPNCTNGTMVRWHGTGSSVVDFAVQLPALLIYLMPGVSTESGENGAVDGPCDDVNERGDVTKLLTYLYSGSAHI